MRPTGSSVALTWASKGERTPSPRQGGEQSAHGDSAGPADLVCARSSGGRRGGGDRKGFGDDSADDIGLSKPFNSFRNPADRLERKDFCSSEPKSEAFPIVVPKTD